MLDIGFLLAVLVFGLLAIRVVFRIIRRSARRVDSTRYDFDLSDLARMVERGQITEEEFRRARDVILSRTEVKFEPVKGFPVLRPVDQEKPDQK